MQHRRRIDRLRIHHARNPLQARDDHGLLPVLQRGKAARLTLAELSPPDAARKPLQYSFRYFQDLKTAVVLPPDFAPERVQVIIRTQGKTSKTVEEFFIWEVKPG